MLADRRVHTTLPAPDVDALRPFYEETLGLTPLAVRPAAVVYRVRDGSIFVLSRSGAKPGGHIVTTSLPRGNITLPAVLFTIGGRTHHAGQAGGSHENERHEDCRCAHGCGSGDLSRHLFGLPPRVSRLKSPIA